MGKRQDFNRRKSTESVGQLYPILLSKDGRVIDGFHRKNTDINWRTETLDHIDTPEKILLARAVSNWHRRKVSRFEKKRWVNELAQIYIDQGLKVYSDKHEKAGGPPNEIMNKIMENLGVCRQTVTTYLDSSFKQTGKGGNQGGPRVPASQAIETLARRRRLAGDLVSRHELEIREKLLHDEKFRDQVLYQIEKEAALANIEPDDPVEAMTSQSFRNMVFHFQDELRRLNGSRISSIFEAKDGKALVKHGVVKIRSKFFRVRVVTPRAQQILDELDSELAINPYSSS